MGKDQDIDYLIARFAAGTISKTELEILIRWYNSFDDTEATVYSVKHDDVEQLKTRMHQRLMRQISEKATVKKTTTIAPHHFLPYAAAVLLILLGVWYFTFTHQPLSDRTDAHVSVNDVAPGGNRATLTFADGRTVALDETQSGIIVDDQNISYRDGDKLLELRNHAGAVQYATLTTPRGGTYEITLPDGTRVWLNAASTLKYPSFFNGDERVVELEGEAYFSVTEYTGEKGNIPFKVLSKGQTTEVLGTEFNITAYSEETNIKTTLVSGKVKVVSGNETTILQPGQQSILGNRGIQVETLDVRPYIAWKDGQFHFQRTPFEEIMKQVTRWYDVEIVYGQGIPQETFSGKVNRNVSLKGVLNIFQLSTIDIRLDGNRLIINEK